MTLSTSRSRSRTTVSYLNLVRVLEPSSDVLTEWGRIRSQLILFLLERKRLRVRMRHRDAMVMRLLQLQRVLVDLHPHTYDRETMEEVVPFPWDLAHHGYIADVISLPSTADLPGAVFRELLPTVIPISKHERAREVMSLLTGRCYEGALPSADQDSHTNSILTRSARTTTDPLA